MRAAYTATAVRSGRWWAIEVPDVPGVYSHVRRLDQVEALAREAIAVTLGIPEDSFDIVVDPKLNTLGDLGKTIETALATRRAAQQAQDTASTAIRHAVRELRSAGYSARDAGMLLGVSNQRVSQLEHAQGRKPTTGS